MKCLLHILTWDCSSTRKSLWYRYISYFLTSPYTISKKSLIYLFWAWDFPLITFKNMPSIFIFQWGNWLTNSAGACICQLLLWCPLLLLFLLAVLEEHIRSPELTLSLSLSLSRGSTNRWHYTYKMKRNEWGIVLKAQHLQIQRAYIYSDIYIDIHM